MTIEQLIYAAQAERERDVAMGRIRELEEELAITTSNLRIATKLRNDAEHELIKLQTRLTQVEEGRRAYAARAKEAEDQLSKIQQVLSGK